MRTHLFLVLALILLLAGCGGGTTDPQTTSAKTAPVPAQTAALAENAFPAMTDEPAAPEPAPAAGEESGLTEEFLTHQRFVLSRVNEAEVPTFAESVAPALEFGVGFTVSGRVCNTFRGAGKLADGRLTVRDLVSTKMACPDSALGELEPRFFQMLESGAHLSMDGANLYLKQGDNTLVFTADTSPGAVP